ncbi:hypothetical protein TNCV_475851 [Trichonephila clavipes]|nr:hypothetical protein TNCV_475851 [Trichonephila clavipes]
MMWLINIRGDRMSYVMASYTITPVVEQVCHCTENVELWRLSRCLHERTSLTSLPKLHLDSSLNILLLYSVAVKLLRVRYHFNWRDARHLAMVPNSTDARSEGSAYVWMGEHDRVVLEVYRMMCRSSRLLICLGCPKSGRETELSLVHWDQYLL